MDGGRLACTLSALFMRLLWVTDLSEVQVGPHLHIIPSA